MENNVHVQKTADISSLVCVVIVSLSALTAYNLGEKFNHHFYYLFGNAHFDLCRIPQSNGRAL